jgi:hypothetical protein
MKHRLYVFVVRFLPFIIILICSGGFVNGALQNGRPIFWVYAGLFGLAAVVLLCWNLITMRQKPPGSDEPKMGEGQRQGTNTV